MSEMIHFFGYAAIDNNKTGFFEYAEVNEELAATHYGFRKTNEDALTEVV